MKSIIFFITIAFINFLILLITINLLGNLEYGSAVAFCIISAFNTSVLFQMLNKK